MPKTVLRLSADKQILASGSREEIDLLLARFKNPAETLDNDGLPLKTHLWRRVDGLDVVRVALDHKLPLSPSDLFAAVADRADQLVPFHTSTSFPDWLVERLKGFEAGGLDLSAKNSENGNTLIQRVADCEIFLGGVIEFLESRGLDPIARTAGKKSAFERVLRVAAQEEFDTLAHEAAQHHSGLADMLAAVSSQPSLAEQEKNGAIGLGGFITARERRERSELRTLWLEHCVALGAAIPKKWASEAEDEMANWMRSAGLAREWKNRPRCESPLRARLEAAEIRRALGTAGAQAPSGRGSREAADRQSETPPKREPPRI
jgi:hypothetical protein